MKFRIGFLIGTLFVAFISWVVSGKKQGVDNNFKTARQHNFALEQYDTVPPPHELVMSSLIPKIRNDNYQYDSIYVTCLPHRKENESVYTVTGVNYLLYHFFSPKKNLSDTVTWVMYDPQGDSAFKYLEHYYDD